MYKAIELHSIAYEGWNCLEILSGEVRLIVPLEIGPRIVHLSFGDTPNLFCLIEDEKGGSEETEWKLRGGHRLWLAPEDLRRTYQPDNHSVTFEELPDKGIRIVAPIEAATGMRKILEIRWIKDATLEISHIIENTTLWPIETAVWALSVMNRGGYEVISLPQKGVFPTDCSPAHSIVPWPYASIADPCWDWRDNRLGVRADTVISRQKLGITKHDGWVAYWQPQGTLVKHVTLDSSATYPDRGCVFETFICDFMIEMETLSPLRRIPPGGSVCHTEIWSLLDWKNIPDCDEEYSRLEAAVSAVKQGLNL